MRDVRVIRAVRDVEIVEHFGVVYKRPGAPSRQSFSLFAFFLSSKNNDLPERKSKNRAASTVPPIRFALTASGRLPHRSHVTKAERRSPFSLITRTANCVSRALSVSPRILSLLVRTIATAARFRQVC